ncbi:transposase, partial [Arthrobacter crystallopoietes BAB-32]
ALNHAATRLPDVDKLRPPMLGIDEHRFRSVRFFNLSCTRLVALRVWW